MLRVARYFANETNLLRSLYKSIYFKYALQKYICCEKQFFSHFDTNVSLQEHNQGPQIPLPESKMTRCFPAKNMAQK